MKRNIWWLLNRLGVMPLMTVWSLCDRKFGRWSDKSVPFLVLCVMFMAYSPSLFVSDANVVFCLILSICSLLNWAIFMVTESYAKYDIVICDIYVRMLLKKILFRKKVRMYIT